MNLGPDVTHLSRADNLTGCSGNWDAIWLVFLVPSPLKNINKGSHILILKLLVGCVEVEESSLDY